jgi:hypothetical protein
MRVTSVPEIPESIGVYTGTNSPQTATNQSNTNEPLKPAPSAVKEEPKVEGEQISQKYADWAKKEKLFRSKVQAREEALRQREEAIKAKESEYGANYIQKSKIPELFQKDSQQALRELGLSGDTLTQALLNQPSPQDLKIQELEAKIAALTGGIDETKGLLDKRDQQAFETAVNQVRFDVKEFITEDPVFEVIKTTGSEEDVVQYILDEHKKNGIIPTIPQAAKAIEDKLFSGILEYAQIPKIKQKLQELFAPQNQMKVAEAPKQAPTKTLVHSQVSSAQRPMSARERAILAFEGKL